MNTYHPKISIVIPVYNGTDYMCEAIDSALAQTYHNKEIIVVNDGSRDDGKTLAAAQSYGDKIRLINKPNGGVATALNAGIKAANGDYVSWLSHDDVYPIDKLEKQVNFLSTLSDRNLVLFGDYMVIDEMGKKMGVISTSHIDTKNMLFELYVSQCIHGCSLLVPKATIDKAGGFREDLPTTQDYDLWLRIAQKTQFIHLPGVFIYSRQHARQGSRTHLGHSKEVIDFYLNNIGLFTPAWLNAHYAPEILKDKYLQLLQTLSHKNAWSAYLKIFQQALNHLPFKNKLNSVAFIINALFMGCIMSIQKSLKSMVPLKVKHIIRRGLNALDRDRKPSKLDFVEIYKQNVFGSDESHSGVGSTMEQTAYIRSVFPDLFKELNIKSILDAPCGDFNWMRHVNLDGIRYTGGDIVPDLIKKDNEKYRAENIEFRDLNIITDKLPKVDLIICRDCLVHLNFEAGLKAVQNFKRSGSTYLLATTFTDRGRNDELYGIWRTLNLQKAPFNFPEPIRMINEHCTEVDGQFGDKSLGLWKLSDI